MKPFLYFLLLAYPWLISSACDKQNFCNGHGSCDESTSSCVCYPGFGAATDVTLYRAPDCSALSCPAGPAWADVPTLSLTAHALAECSNMGTCDRKTGLCKCFKGFTGDACQRNKCPNDCSGHGQCFSMKQLAQMSTAQPLNPNTFYEGSEDTTTWDSEMLYGCVCESSWSVGLEDGQTQQAEWFGADCSLRRCPSANNPYTTLVDETNCVNKNLVGGSSTGAAGNKCHVDCANQGVCDFSTGTCKCFDGYYGVDCTSRDVRAVYSHNKK